MSIHPWVLIWACSNGVRSPDDDLVELLWHNGSIVAQPQAHHRPEPSNRLGSSGLTGEESTAWFPDTIDDALEKDLCATATEASAQGGGKAPAARRRVGEGRGP